MIGLTTLVTITRPSDTVDAEGRPAAGWSEVGTCLGALRVRQISQGGEPGGAGWSLTEVVFATLDPASITTPVHPGDQLVGTDPADPSQVGTFNVVGVSVVGPTVRATCRRERS